MGAPVEVQGLTEFRRALRAMDPAFARELSKTHRGIAKRAGMASRTKAQSLGAPQRREAGAIGWSGTMTGAVVRVSQSARFPFANPTFWGRTSRTGWYAEKWAASHSGRAQGLPWVGSSWDVGVRGQGPYAINDAIADELPSIMKDYSEALDDLFGRAFDTR